MLTEQSVYMQGRSLTVWRIVEIDNFYQLKEDLNNCLVALILLMEESHEGKIGAVRSDINNTKPHKSDFNVTKSLRRWSLNTHIFFYTILYLPCILCMCSFILVHGPCWPMNGVFSRYLRDFAHEKVGLLYNIKVLISNQGRQTIIMWIFLEVSVKPAFNVSTYLYSMVFICLGIFSIPDKWLDLENIRFSFCYIIKFCLFCLSSSSICHGHIFKLKLRLMCQILFTLIREIKYI